MESPKEEKKGIMRSIKDGISNTANKAKSYVSDGIEDAEKFAMEQMLESFMPKIMKMLPKVLPKIEEYASENLEGKICIVQKDSTGKVSIMILNREAVELKTKEGYTGDDAVSSVTDLAGVIESVITLMNKPKDE